MPLKYLHPGPSPLLPYTAVMRYAVLCDLLDGKFAGRVDLLVDAVAGFGDLLVDVHALFAAIHAAIANFYQRT